MKKIVFFTILMMLLSVTSFAEKAPNWRILYYNVKSRTSYYFSEKSVVHDEVGWYYLFKEERENVSHYFIGKRHCKRESEKIFIKSTDVKICEKNKCHSINDVDWQEAEPGTLYKILCLGDIEGS